MAEVQWSVQQMREIGYALSVLEELLQEWEGEHSLKIGDLQITIETEERPVTHLGFVSMLDKSDTTLQFEVLDVEPTLTIC